jgi:transcriptional regulator with XRE-family HTH domain
MTYRTFGSFLTEKRIARDMTLRGFAGQLGISPVHMCNMEKDRRAAPTEDVLERMAALLMLTHAEKIEMLDLAAKSKNAPSVALDLPEYINERDIVRVALRTAKDVDATDEEWQEFIEKLQSRIVKDTDKTNDELNGG